MMTDSSQRVQIPVWAALRNFSGRGVYVDLATIAQRKEDAEEIAQEVNERHSDFAKENKIVRYSVIWLEFELKEGEVLMRSTNVLNGDEDVTHSDDPPSEGK